MIWEAMLEEEKKKKHAETAAGEALKKGIKLGKEYYDKATVKENKKDAKELLDKFSKAEDDIKKNVSSSTIKAMKDVVDEVINFQNISNDNEFSNVARRVSAKKALAENLVTEYEAELVNPKKNPANKLKLETEITDFHNLTFNEDIIRIQNDIKTNAAAASAAAAAAAAASASAASASAAPVAAATPITIKSPTAASASAPVAAAPVAAASASAPSIIIKSPTAAATTTAPVVPGGSRKKSYHKRTKKQKRHHKKYKTKKHHKKYNRTKKYKNIS